MPQLAWHRWPLSLLGYGGLWGFLLRASPSHLQKRMPAFAKEVVVLRVLSWG